METQPKFTPGPWEYEDDGRFGCVGAEGRDGAGWMVCDLSVHVDLVCNSAEHLSPDILDECEANGRLIAAAPELLEALEEGLNALRGYAANAGSDHIQDLVRARMEAAIAKATANEGAA